MAISERTKEVFDAIIDNPNKTAVDIAAKMGVSVGQVTGAVNSLKKANMIVIEDGKITATAEAEFEFGDGPGLPAAAAPASSKKVAAKALAADTSDVDDAELAPTVTSGETATDVTIVEASTETIIEAETAGEVAATAVDAIEELADTPVPMSTMIPGTAPASVAPAKAPAGESKASKARAIFMANKDQPRKVLMAMMMEQCGLTSHGANTYLYNFRKAEGMVKTRTAEVAADATPAVVTEADAPAFVEAATDNIVIDVSAPEVVAEVVEIPAEVAAEAVVDEADAAKVGE
jgi:hypothetical protein